MDFQTTQPPSEAATDGVTLELADREIYEIERLAAKLTLAEYRPGVRTSTSLRFAVESAIDFAFRNPDQALVVPQREPGERKVTNLRISAQARENLDLLRIREKRRSGVTLVLAAIQLAHRTIDAQEKRRRT